MDGQGEGGALRLRVLSFNIQAGARTGRYHQYLTRSWQHLLPTSKQRQLSGIAQLARDFDLVGLQEADAGTLRSGFLDQAEWLADAAGFPYYTHVANRQLGRLASSGNSLLSRLPPTAAENHALPGLKGRGVLLVRFGAGASAWTVAIAHLALTTAGRGRQFDFLAELLADRGRVVLMGDFNCTPAAPEFRRFLGRSGLQATNAGAEPTFPSWRPRREIDHVLVSAGIEVLGFRTLAAADSDHLPVAAELRLPCAA